MLGWTKDKGRGNASRLLFIYSTVTIRSLQESIAENFDVETVYVKEENDSTETQVKFVN